MRIKDSGSVSSAGARVSGCQFCTPAKSSTGVYTLTLTDGLDSTLGNIVCSLMGASGTLYAAWTSDTVITVSTFAVDGTTATDKAFSFVILDQGVG